MNTNSALLLPDQYIEKINFLLESKKIYRQKDISLNYLAMRLRTNRTYLSATINNYYRKSFPKLLNEYRINEACELLRNNELSRKFTIEGIGMEVGYANRMSFYRAFKQIKGISVGKYVESIGFKFIVVEHI